jgi:hypothetical protein
LKLKAQPDSVYDDIYSKAAPYLDTRRNDIHVSLSCDFGRRLLALYPNVAKAGGLQSQGVKGEVVVVYRDPFTTQDLKSSGFPAG